MADISTLLDRVAATPTRGPDVETPWRRARRRRFAARSIATALIVAAIVVTVVGVVRPKREHLYVGSTTTTTAVPAASQFHDATNHFTITIPAGWYRAEQPLAPWLVSPHEILSLATVPLAPIPLDGNQAACPSEIPKAAVQHLGPDDAYLWIGEWIPGEGTYTAEPRPPASAALHWQHECPLPDGITATGATFRDQNRDFTVHLVLGGHASARRTQLYAILDSFHPDPTTPMSAASTTTTQPPMTEQITYEPFTATGTIDPNLRITSHVAGTCVSGETSRAYRCFGESASGVIYDPCFASPLMTSEPLVCPRNPATGDVVAFSATSLPTPAPNKATRPWAMQLSNGQVCLFVSAAWSGLGPYNCQTENTPIWADCRQPQPSQPFWTTECQYQETNTSTFSPNDVRRVWF